MPTIATICARGGSKGVPRKNLRHLAGKPLIVHTIEQALACPLFSGVYVSTDDEGIAEVAQQAGAKVPFLRPTEMAQDHSPKLPVIRHLVDWINEHDTPVEKIVDLDPTSPLRSLQDIIDAYQLLDEHTDVVLTGYSSDKNPYFNMVEIDGDGRVMLSKAPESPVFARQKAPAVYSLNGSVYVWWNHTLTDSLWSGRSKLHIMPRERSIDIDSEIDFHLVELLFEKSHLHHR